MGVGAWFCTKKTLFPTDLVSFSAQCHFESAQVCSRIDNNEHGKPRRSGIYGQATGGHCPGDRRLHTAEEGRRSEFFRAVPVSSGEDAVIQRACHAPVLSLFRLRQVRRRL